MSRRPGSELASRPLHFIWIADSSGSMEQDGKIQALNTAIRIGRSVVMLNFDTGLFPHHVNEQKIYDFSAPVAAVTEHPSSSGVWGLKNLSPRKWVVSAPGGDVKDVETGRSVTLAVGTRIQFGETVGEIKL